ncbi:MAG: hydrolase [Pseudomonadota bacterium]
MNFAYLDSLKPRQQALLDTLCAWSEINSGSTNVAGVAQMARVIGDYAESRLQLPYTLHEVAPLRVIDDEGGWQDQPVGPVLRMHKQTGAPRKVVLVGHLDTVFAADDSFQTITQLEADKLGGPGVADMKGGILVMLSALELFAASPHAAALDWELVLNPDEEIGSQSSMPLVLDAARGAYAGMVYEPAMPDGSLAGARKGSGNFTLIVHGRAAHAGREFLRGRNAIVKLAEVIAQLTSINGGEDITLNLGRIQGGGALNIVPDLAIGRFNVRVADAGAQARVETFLADVLKSLDNESDYRFELHGGFGRPAKPVTDAQQKLFDVVARCGSQLGLDLTFHATGGCCDGNNLLAAGVPNVDTLGVQGGAIHSHAEYMLPSSILPRAQLSTLILESLAQEAK